MRRFLSRWFVFQPVSLPEQMKALWGTEIKAKRIDGMELPERDESKPGCVHCYSDNDILALQLRREAEAARQPKVVQMKVGRTGR